ncbi:hypothetical protein EKG37_12155 [Robertmurraya yapensis]|uniref:YtkA-like domain-containing protein n=1 Tax=Bacillus yapensis TaxID=2492960 RepID=A0A3S0RL27_9BACI|nr:FixH family protein [Bacillus yapensis]RTR31049.1 hypothetical protein EKG37_12155 [Bacillus yapensis]TKS95478.1 hypothetical protein FAR12_12155 [Bacillus yapensis]
MKKLLSILLITLVGIVFITGCAQKDEKSEEPLFTEVELSVNPENGEVNEPVIIEAKVTYGEEEVTDADEVLFEIWRSHDEEHEKMEIKHAENGIYRLEKSFEQEGTYYVISHVTAREMHNMPKTEFVIGEASEPEEDSSSQMNMEEHEEGEH